MFPTFGGFILFSLSLVVSGCGGLIPSEFREKIQRDVSLQNLQQDPEAYKGQLVLLGGEIRDVKNSEDGDTVEVLHRPLNTSSRPNLIGESEGRFVIKLTKEVSPEKSYREGQPLTVVGEVMEEAESRAGKDIPSPILLARYLHLWSAVDYAHRTPPPYYYSDPFFHRRLLLRPKR
jgi:outer membrane lipoprotein